MDKPHPQFRAIVFGGKSLDYMPVFLVVIRITRKVAQSLIDISSMVFIVAGIDQVKGVV